MTHAHAQRPPCPAARLALPSLLALLLAQAAQAGGLDYPGPGTRALGRAAAFAARGDDPMALSYNPALIGLSGRVALLVNTHLAFFDACVQRSGTYTDNVTLRDRSRFGDSELPPGGGGYALEPFPLVCNAGPPIPAPAIVASLALGSRFGLALGLLLPATTGAVQWGSRDGTVLGRQGELRPNPLRYLALSAGGFALSPSAGLSWQATPWLRLGGTLQWSIFALDGLSYGVTTGGENPSLDGRARIRGADHFVPAVIVGAHLTPTRALELATTLRWSDDLRGSADIDMRFGDYGSSEPGSSVPTDSRLRDLSLHFPMPWQLTAGLRYVSRRARRAAKHGASAQPDALRDERWDLEFDVVFERNGRVDEVVLRPPEGLTLTTRQVLSDGTLLTLEVPVDNAFRVPRGWRDQLSLRLGGDYALARDRCALRGGVSYETRGLDPALATLDFLPVRRLGLHLGATLRLSRHIDLSAAFAHLYQEALEVPSADQPGGARLAQMSADGSGRIVNAGSFRSHWDIFSLGATYLF